jgi:hypothetical protein
VQLGCAATVVAPCHKPATRHAQKSTPWPYPSGPRSGKGSAESCRWACRHSRAIDRADPLASDGPAAERKH